MASKRKKIESTQLANYYVTSTTSVSQDVAVESSDEAFWRVKYYAVLDSVIENIKYRFSDESLALANTVDKFVLFDFTGSKLFIDHYKVRIGKKLPTLIIIKL